MRLGVQTPHQRDWLILVVLALAILVRVIYLLQYRASPFWEQLTVDNWYHHHWAQSLAGGNILGDTTYFRAPLYAYCLGLLYALLGDSFWVGRLFGFAIGVTSLVMTYVVARRFLGARFAAVAAAIQGFLPVVIYFETELLLDPLYMLLMQVAVWRMLIWLDTQRQRDLFLCGLATGLAAICRPIVLAPALVVLIWAAWGQRLYWNRILRGAVFILGVLVFITPIFIRNLVIANDPVLIASQDGINLYLGNNAQADGLSAVMPEPLGHNWQIRQITHIAQSELGHKLKPGEVSAYWRGQAVDWIKENPGSFLSLWAKKMIYQFGDREISNNRPLQSYFSSFGLLDHNPLSFGLVFPCAVLGAVVWWRRHPAARLVVFMIAIYAIAVALFFFSSRFRLPIIPYFCMLAAAGLFWIQEQLRRQLIVVAAALAALIGLGWLSFHPPIAYPDTWSVQSLVSRGLLLYSKGDFHSALEPFRRAAEINPAFPDVNLNLGATYLRIERLDSAETCFRREIQLHPLRHQAYQNLAATELVRGKTLQAKAHAEQALSLAPYDVMSNLVWLRTLGSDSLLGSSVLAGDVARAAGVTDDNVEVLNEGAAILVARGECEAAMGFLFRALESKPPPIETDDQAFSPSFRHGAADFARSKAKTLYLRGYCHGQEGRVDEAIEYSRRAIEADSTLAEAFVNLYSGYLTQGRLREAESVRAEAERRFPGNELVSRMKVPSR